MEDGTTARGSITTVQQVGNTIRRPTGHWTPVVHALLKHLEQVGFAGAPRVLGIDPEGREILSFLPGAVVLRPWPPVLQEDHALRVLAEFLRAYHDAVRGFTPPTAAQWYVPGLTWRPGHIVRHGDLGLWNTVWDSDRLVGAIDWDFAEPGDPLEDVAQVAWYCVPLRDESQWRAAGFTEAPDAWGRLETLCTTYGVAPHDVLDTLVALQRTEMTRTLHFGHQGIEPWASFLQRGDVEEMQLEAAWLAAWRGAAGR